MDNRQLTELLHQMTLEEKIAQLLQLTANFHEGGESQITGPLEEMGITESMVTASGSVLGLSGAQSVIDVQKSYLSKSRLGIPLMFMADVVHGFKRSFRSRWRSDAPGIRSWLKRVPKLPRESRRYPVFM